MVTDPLAHLNYTTNGFCAVLRMMKELAPRWIALGGGGYEIANVARAWTLAWGIMNDAEPPDEIPEAFLREHHQEGFRGRGLRDPQHAETGQTKDAMRKEVRRVVEEIRERVFPLIIPGH